MKSRIADFIASSYSSSDDEFLIDMVIDRFLWAATEDNDQNQRVKYLGQPYWSKDAILQYREQNSGRRLKKFNDLRHEHIVPRNLIKSFIKDLEDKSSKNILDILSKYSHAVIVTKVEDARLKKLGLNKDMPSSFYKSGCVLSRYQSADIEIVDVSGKDLKTMHL